MSESKKQKVGEEPMEVEEAAVAKPTGDMQQEFSPELLRLCAA